MAENWYLLRQKVAAAWAGELTGDHVDPRGHLQRLRASEHFDNSCDPGSKVREKSLVIHCKAGHELLVTLTRYVGITTQAAQRIPVPLVVLFGDGWVVHWREGMRQLSQSLAVATRALVANVEYRLAPEHPFPAAVEDCLEALLFLTAHGERLLVDPRKVAVVGEGMGANLAAVTALAARPLLPHPLQLQGLLFPPLDPQLRSASWTARRRGPGLPRAAMAWLWRQYLPDPIAALDERASPLRAATLETACPAFIATADHDPLQDEAELYAERLRAAGVPVQLQCYRGWNGMHRIPQRIGTVDGPRVVRELAEALVKVFAVRAEG
eukprot:EG_transcript_13172